MHTWKWQHYNPKSLPAHFQDWHFMLQPSMQKAAILRCPTTFLLVHITARKQNPLRLFWWSVRSKEGISVLSK